MPNTDHDPMDARFEWRLKAALDRVMPPSSSPRYATTTIGGAKAWPLGPAVLAAGASVVLLAVTATATTGSPNPAVWAERAGSTLQSVGHAPFEAVPSPEASPERPAETPHSAQGAPPQAGHDAEHEGAQSLEPSQGDDREKGSTESPQPQPPDLPGDPKDPRASTAPITPPLD